MLSSNYSFSSVSSCTSQRRGEISSKEKKLTELVVLVTVLAYKVESRWRQSLDIFVLPASFVRGERRKKKSKSAISFSSPSVFQIDFH